MFFINSTNKLSQLRKESTKGEIEEVKECNFVNVIEIQKGRVRMCSIFQVDGFIGIVQLVVPFSAWGLGQHIYLDFFVLLTCFSHFKLHTRIIILKITFCKFIGIISS